ncbi:MAG: 3-dehydroquinate synthase [Ruminococcaceae bacterium]|nr:3-dehydroquinate synthase [Oscillospiraceae bacterium]
MKTIKLNLNERSYNISVESGLLEKADKILNLNRKVFILTDTGVPREYSEKILAKSKEAVIFTVAEGESSKSMATLSKIFEVMLGFEMSRGDCLVAVGGGVIGDLGGFAASIYMRGIDFYNVPTTLLAQVDSSIGGKTAVNFKGIKNVIGSFYQPKAVLIDVDTLKTLPKRQISAGLAETVKMALTSDSELFEIFEKNTALDIEEIVIRSLMIKRAVVEADERESGLRKILNFGHTLGHGIESDADLHGLYHGECVALGMLPMCSGEVRDRLLPILKKLNLPTSYTGDIDNALNFIVHDKKTKNGFVEAIFVDKIGQYRIEKISVDDFSSMIKERLSAI